MNTMKKIDETLSHVIFYFSGTGNTWWVAQELSQNLEKQGIPGSAISIETVNLNSVNELISANQLIGFGYPVYASDIPQPMKDFMSMLPVQDAKAAFVFCTQWLWSGDGAFVGASFLAKRGFAVGWGEHFLMPNNVCISSLHLPYTNNFERLKPVLIKAGKRARFFARHLSEGRLFRRGFNRLAVFLGTIQRAPYRKFFPRMRNYMGIDRSRCNRCGLCIKFCPARNLIWKESGEGITTIGVCVLCLRCYCFCPHTAITYKNKPHNLRKGKPYRGPTEDFSWTYLIGQE